MQISETSSAKGKSERGQPSLLMNSCSPFKPFCGYSETHPVFLSSDNKNTVLDIVSVTSETTVVLPLRVVLDLWLRKWCLSEERRAADVCELTVL